MPMRNPDHPQQRFLRPVLAWLRLCMARRRQRVILAELDGRLLEDIGVTRAEAWREAKKPCWKG